MKKELRILIVDDENINITVLMDILESEYIVQVAKNGIKALEIAKKSLPDLILLDIVMPEMDGYEVCNKLKSNSDTDNIPIIFITSKSEHEDEVKGLSLGAVDYITKPFNPTVVQTRVKTQLDLKLYREQMEKLVIKRTIELKESNEKLVDQSKELDKTNVALRVMLDVKDEAQKEVEEKILCNIKDIVLPFLAKVKLGNVTKSQQTLLDLIESNLNNIIAPFAVDVSSKFYNLTSTEIQIATLVREEKSTKEIAALLNLAVSTAEKHRDNIRKKLNINNKKVNLQSYLKSIQK